MSQPEQEQDKPIADSTPATAPDAVQYPEQKHAGKVGYGPNYHQDASLGEKATGFKEEVLGKVKHDEGMIAHGHELRTGALKKKALEEDLSAPLPGAEDAGKDKKPDDAKAGSAGVTAAAEQAATVAPEGTADAERQRTGEQGAATRMVDHKNP